VTAHELVAEIFGRQQHGVSGDMRYITVPQLDYLRGLIEENKEAAAALRPGRGRSFVWAPSSCGKYVVTEGVGGRRNTITRMMDVRPSGEGMLFGPQPDDL
jgi:hypothetical protein